MSSWKRTSRKRTPSSLLTLETRTGSTYTTDLRHIRDFLSGWSAMKNSYFLDMMRAQEKWRLEDSINLLPSENMSSPQVRALLSSDFVNRYTLPINAEYAGEFIENSYRGTRITTDVELKAE